MNATDKVEAKHKLNGEVKTFTLVATALKRQGKDSAPKYYPYFQDTENNWEFISGVMGEEYLQELALDALVTKFQQLYFNRSPSGKQVPVVKADGSVATIVNSEGKTVQVTQADETPRMEQFLAMIEDENLSGRSIDSAYCMRKAINIQTGVDKKWASKPELERMTESMKWIQKAQSLMVEELKAAKE